MTARLDGLPPSNMGACSQLDGNYMTIHKRLYRYRGPAYLYACYLCGTQAREWSCMKITNVQMDRHAGFQAYSTNLLEDYQPMCGSCAQLADVFVMAQYQRELGT